MARPQKKEINLTKESMLSLMQEIYNELVEQRATGFAGITCKANGEGQIPSLNSRQKMSI